MVFSISGKALPGKATSRTKTPFCSFSKPGKVVAGLSSVGGTNPSREPIGNTASAAAAGGGANESTTATAPAISDLRT